MAALISTLRREPCAHRLVLLTALLFAPASALTQETAPPRTAVESTPTLAPRTAVPPAITPTNNAPKNGVERLPVETRYLPNEKGELVPVPLDASLEGYLEFLRRQRETPTDRPPSISVTAIDLDGTASADFVTLQARLMVEVLDAAQPVRFPLALSEAVIQQADVKTNGRAVFGGKDPERGYSWWLYGPGSYEFQLKLGLPIRKLSPWRRIQLSLPSSPVTALRLKLPVSASAVKLVPDDAVLETTALDSGQTEIRSSGFGSRLDLSWQTISVVGNQSTSLDVNTTLLVRGAAEGLFIEATQVVRALQGVFREVVVHLPNESELLQVDGSEIAETRIDPENPQLVTVGLTASTAGPVTFRWRVRMPHTERRRMVLQGFSVESAKRQAGSIGLVEVDDASWTVVESGEPHLERMNAGEFRALTNGVPVVRAYRFYAQPFRLPLTLESVAAYYDVQPVLALYAAEDELRLEGRFHVRTFRGELTQLAWLWPGWQAEGWVLEGIQPQGDVVSGFPTTDSAEPEGRIVVNLSDQAPGEFEVRFSARRARRGSEETRLSLPLVEGPPPTSTQVVLVSAVNVDADLSPRGETALQRLAHDVAPASEAFGFEQGLRTQAFRLDSEERQFSVRVAPQPQRIRVTSQTRAELSSRRLDVRQTIKHHVEYARLSDIALVVPVEIAERMTFRHGETELVPEWTEASTPQERIAWLMLPRGQLGTVTLDLEWTLPLPEAWIGDREATLPIEFVRSEFAPSDQSTLEIIRPAWFELTAGDPQWLLQHADDQRVRWQTSAAVSEFPLILTPSARGTVRQFQVTRAVIRAVVDATGGQDYRFSARLSGDSQDLFLHLPAKASPPQIWWDGVLLPRESLLELPAASRHFSLRIPEGSESGQDHLLTVEYHLTAGRPLGWSAALIAVAPQLPQCEWSAQVLWDLHLPGNQHLWMPPPGAAPMYRWERSRWYWRRVSSPGSQEMQSWLEGGLPAAPDGLAPPRGNQYAFRQLGDAQDLRVRTLSAPMTLVCGAGLSLAVGFLALWFASLRSLVVVLSALCGLAVASLWHLAELELLFQPMAIGAVFPTLIAAAELWYRRRTLRSAWTLSASVNEYRPPSSELQPTQSLSPRADSATIFRTPLSNEGSGVRISAESQAG
jgi:hypothetical protein